MFQVLGRGWFGPHRGTEPAMDIELTPPESAAVRAALRNYVSSLRMEIVDTDNPAFKRDLKHERELLEAALTKLDGGGLDDGREAADGAEVVRVVRIWWAAG
jgi:hypothetical protein